MWKNQKLHHKLFGRPRTWWIWLLLKIYRHNREWSTRVIQYDADYKSNSTTTTAGWPYDGQTFAKSLYDEYQRIEWRSTTSRTPLNSCNTTRCRYRRTDADNRTNSVWCPRTRVYSTKSPSHRWNSTCRKGNATHSHKISPRWRVSLGPAGNATTVQFAARSCHIVSLIQLPLKKTKHNFFYRFFIMQNNHILFYATTKHQVWNIIKRRIDDCVDKNNT